MLRAIETAYRGYRFRSRMEARWAVFFETLGIRWEYEPEGFVLSNGEWYLPDFRIWLDNEPWWIEVKPSISDSSPKFERLMMDLEKNDKPPLGAIVGNIPDPTGDVYNGNPPMAIGVWFDPERCFLINAEGQVIIGYYRHHGVESDRHPRLVQAYKTARAARF